MSTAIMTDKDVVVEEDEDVGSCNDTLESSVLLHEINGEEVFNKADDLIEDAPSLPNATEGKKMMQKRKRRSLKFRRKGGWWYKKGSYEGRLQLQVKRQATSSKSQCCCFYVRFNLCRF